MQFRKNRNFIPEPAGIVHTGELAYIGQITFSEWNRMQVLVKTIVSVIIILTVTEIGKKLPSAAGLISVMPLIGTLVLVWMYQETGGDPLIMRQYAQGALWGIFPSILFFFVAYLCFMRNLPLSVVLISSYGVWFCAALIHQWILK